MGKRVLCMGAYANGNLGDMYQAQAIARIIAGVDPTATVTSVSPSKRGTPYPHSNHVAGPVDGAFDPDYINQFDLLLVGGGGLLAAPHAPLNNADWVSRIQIPIYALSVGVVEATAAVSRDFIDKCAGFSVRDEFSLAALEGFRSDAVIAMDPILLDAATDAQPLPPSRAGMIWVPGKLVANTEEMWAQAIQRGFDKKRDRIISFNPETDKSSGFEMVFAGVEYLQEIDPFVDMVRNSRVVVSERYHACIYAIANGIPAVGICLRSSAVTSKIRQLFKRIGYPDIIVEPPFLKSRDELRDLADNMDMAKVRKYLSAERRALDEFIGRVLGVSRK